MSLLLLAALLVAADPAVPAPAAPPATQKAKVKQVCETVDITGSRSPRRVCHDERTDAVLLPGVSNNGYGKTSTIETGGLSDTTSRPN